MTELARGTIGDRPWGQTLGALGMRGLTGQLIVTSDNRRYQIAFEGGAIIAAASPVVSDAAVRIAMTGGLLSSTQVSDIARRQQANPQRDEVELIAELIRLAPDQAMKLRRRAVAQRAARTFSLERGDFIVDDQITLPVVPGAELDVRSVIFLGARANLSEARLTNEIAVFGNWFQLRPEVLVDLPQYGFGSSEDPVLDILEQGALLSDLETMGSDPHVVRAMVYALASCNSLEMEGGQRPVARAQPAARPQPSPEPPRAPAAAAAPPVRIPPQQPRPQPPVQAQPRPQPRPQPPAHPPAPDEYPVDGATTRRVHDDIDGATVRRPTGLDAPTSPRSQMGAPPRAVRSNLDPAQATEVKALIKKHLELLKKKADHFKLLGTHENATPDEVRKAYFALARQLHPDRLSALGISDDTKEAQRLFAEVNTAFGVLSDPERRAEYTNVMRRGGAAGIAAEQARAEAMAARIVEAEEAFRRGEALLRRDQLAQAMQELARAVELNPEEVDYHATYAWAEFCASPDKMAIASKTRVTLDRAINKSPRSISPRFFLGRVERMLGRDAEALRHFQDVLQREPHHREAQSEARVIEQRLKKR